MIEAKLPDRPGVRYPLRVERSQDQVLSIPLPEKRPEGMVFIPPGEFLVAATTRRRSGSTPVRCPGTAVTPRVSCCHETR